MSHKLPNNFRMGLAFGAATYILSFLLSLVILGPPYDFNAESWIPLFLMWNCVVSPGLAMIIGRLANEVYSGRKSN